MALFVGFLILVIVILVAVVVFAFWVKPAFNGYVVQKQVDAQNLILANIASTVLQNGFVQIPVGNQTMILVQAQPVQQEQQPEQQIQ